MPADSRLPLESLVLLAPVPRFAFDEWTWAGLGLAGLLGAVWWHLAGATLPDPAARRRARLLTTGLAGCIAAAFATSDLVTYLLALESVGLMMALLIATWCPRTAVLYFTVQMGGVAFVLVGAAAGHFAGNATASGMGAACMLLGMGIKTGMIGAHRWLPAVYAQVPLRVGALPSTLAMCVPFVGLVRFIDAPPPIAAWLGLATVAFGSVQAIRASDPRSWAAYAAMSWSGSLMLAWGGLPAATGTRVILWLIGAHACAKTAFLALLAIKENGGRQTAIQTGATGESPDPAPLPDWRRLGSGLVAGLSSSGGLLALAALASMAGLPPTVESGAKQRLVEGLADHASVHLFAWAGILSVGYALRGGLLLGGGTDPATRSPGQLPWSLTVLLLAGIFGWDQWLDLGPWWSDLNSMGCPRLASWEKATVAIPAGLLLAIGIWYFQNQGTDPIDRTADVTGRPPETPVSQGATGPTGSNGVDVPGRWLGEAAAVVGAAHVGHFRQQLMAALAAGLLILWW